MDSCCSEEVVGCGHLEALEFVAVYDVGVLGVVGSIDVLAGDCWNLGE